MPNPVGCSLFWHLTGNILQWKFSPIIQKLFLTLKRLVGVGGGWGSTGPPACGFLKNVSSIERVKPCFFVIFNEDFIEFPQVVQGIWRNSLLTLANFHQFSSVSWIFWHYLVTKTLMMSAYNRWYQNFSIFNILYWY